jgi:hypothetical protein
VVSLLLALLAFSFVSGAVGGIAAALRPQGRVRIGPAFLVYLGLVAVLATTLSQSLDLLPLTLIYGAAVGALPFGAAFLAARQLVSMLRTRGTRREG